MALGVTEVHTEVSGLSKITFGDVVEFLHFSLIVEIVRTVPSVELFEVLEEGRGCTSSYVIYLRSISSISSVKLTDERASEQASKRAS